MRTSSRSIRHFVAWINSMTGYTEDQLRGGLQVLAPPLTQQCCTMIASPHSSTKAVQLPLSAVQLSTEHGTVAGTYMPPSKGPPVAHAQRSLRWECSCCWRL